MINKIYAQNFVRKISRTMNLNVNVMDERGVIIASSTPDRVGNFHMCAFEIIEKNLPMMVTRVPTKELIGVEAPGVNLRLTSAGETIGVIGVSGNPDEITDIAKMVKLTFETMYEYEYKKNASMKSADSIWHLSHVLLSESPPNPLSIKRAATRLSQADDSPRIPIYIRIEAEYLATVIQHFIDYYPSLSLYRPRDIPLPVDHGILLMKSFLRETGEFTEAAYTDICVGKLNAEFFTRQSIKDRHLSVRYCIGPLQKHFKHYQLIYQNLSWLAAYVNASEHDVHFLSDHYSELLLEAVDPEPLEPLFAHYREAVTENLDLDLFFETVRALLDNNMKLEDAARSLHLHKNSVVSRVNKIKEALNINPISNPNDGVLLRYLYTFMKNDRSPSPQENRRL